MQVVVELYIGCGGWVEHVSSHSHKTNHQHHIISARQEIEAAGSEKQIN